MGLYAQRLTKEEVNSMRDILISLYGDEDTKALIRADFRTYVKKITGTPIDKFTLARTINHPEKATLEYQMLLYDYMYEKLTRAILRHDFSGECPAGLDEKIRAFIRQGDRRSPPWGIPALQDFVEPVPDFFKSQFFGYRLSANFGSVIRFYIDISETNDEDLVTYRNLYHRKETDWDIVGTGRYVRGTLYLIGHATDLTKKDSQGMRVMALRRIGTTKKLCGIVLSADREFPIAARVLLVPLSEHAEPKRKDTASIQEFMMQDVEDHSVSTVVDDLFQKSLDDIKKWEKLDHIQTFSTYIDNTTPTVIKSGAEVSFDIAELTTKMNDLRADANPRKDDGSAGRVAQGMIEAISTYLSNYGPRH